MQGIAILIEVLMTLLGPLITSALSAALGAIVNAVLAALAVVSGLEGLTVTWLILRKRRGKPAHWFWRPTAWSLLALATSVAAAALNVLAVVVALPKGGSELSAGRIVFALALPGLVSAPFTIILLVLVGSTLLGGLRALRAKSPPPAQVLSSAMADTGKAKARARQAAQSGGMRLLGAALVLVGQVLVAFTVLWTALMLVAVVASLTEPGHPASEVVQGILLVVGSIAFFALGAVGLLWLGRPGGRLRPAPVVPAPPPAAAQSSPSPVSAPSNQGPPR